LIFLYKKSSTWLQIQNDYNIICDFFNTKIDEIDKKSFEYIIISESTWVYSSSLCKACHDLWLNHQEVNPRAMHQLWKNIWDRNKTDKIDSEKIANIWEMLFNMNKNWFGKNRLSSVSSNDIKSLKSIMSAIHSSKYDIWKFKQRIASANKDIYAPKWIITDIESSIDLAKKIKAKLVEQAMKIIKKLDIFTGFENLCTIPWVSNEVALELIVFFMDLAEKWIWASDRSKVKAFVWLDVSMQQSWTSIDKKRISKQWNKHVRSILQIGWRCWFRLVKMDKYKNTNLGLFFQRMLNKFETPTKKNGNAISTAMSKKILLVAWWIFWSNRPYNWS